jgi:hypothetical protein
MAAQLEGRSAPNPAIRAPWSASRKRTKHPGAESAGMGVESGRLDTQKDSRASFGGA